MPSSMPFSEHEEDTADEETLDAGASRGERPARQSGAASKKRVYWPNADSGGTGTDSYRFLPIPTDP